MPTLTAVPSRFPAGTSFSYRRSFADYPADQGWDLQLALAGEKRMTLTAAEDGAEFVVSAISSDTTQLKPGSYRWAHIVTKGTDVHVPEKGTLVVTPNLLTALDGELQSPLERRLAMIRAAMDAKITGDIAQYRFDDIEVLRLDLEQLAKLEKETGWALIRQRRRGRPVQTHYIRFGTPRG